MRSGLRAVPAGLLTAATWACAAAKQLQGIVQNSQPWQARCWRGFGQRLGPMRQFCAKVASIVAAWAEQRLVALRASAAWAKACKACPYRIHACWAAGRRAKEAA